MPVEPTERRLHRPLAIADQLLGRLETSGAIVPGSRDEILAGLQEERPGGPAACVARVFEIIDGRSGARYRTPGYVPPASHLKRVLEALPLTRSGRERLARELALQANSAADLDNFLASARRAAEATGLPFDRDAALDQARRTAAARVARLVLDALEERDHRDAWAGEARPEKPLGERTALAAIEAFRDHLAAGIDPEELARAWADDCFGLGPDGARKLVARRLANPSFSRYLCRGGEPLELAWDDPALRPGRSEIEEQQAARAEYLALMGDPSPRM